MAAPACISEVKVALIACMRRFITILNAMVTTQQPWRAPALVTP
jgi:hypothetical protein